MFLSNSRRFEKINTLTMGFGTPHRLSISGSQVRIVRIQSGAKVAVLVLFDRDNGSIWQWYLARF